MEPAQSSLSLVDDVCMDLNVKMKTSVIIGAFIPGLEITFLTPVRFRIIVFCSPPLSFRLVFGGVCFLLLFLGFFSLS